MKETAFKRGCACHSILNFDLASDHDDNGNIHANTDLDELSCAYEFMEVQDARLCIPGKIASTGVEADSCAYELMELEDAPLRRSDSIDGLGAESIGRDETNSMSEQINLAMLKAVQNTVVATFPTIMDGLQTRIDQAIAKVDDKLDAQKLMLASLTKRLPKVSSASKS